ncbi:hypothetical protein SPD48_06335 [Pseudogracilibacillus sp. SE30717A]|uniref:hypothetical protein n=1 Tax=Pseudogracilibacillus sp. SE30717A TaxID=3098293 RepID=UPI00300E5B31
MIYLAKQSYYKVIRKVSSINKIEQEEKRTMYLMRDKLVTAYREFLLQDVLDLSFRRIGDKGGLLYIHTIHGLYSYHVKTSPTEFIYECKKQLIQ